MIWEWIRQLLQEIMTPCLNIAVARSCLLCWYQVGMPAAKPRPKPLLEKEITPAMFYGPPQPPRAKHAPVPPPKPVTAPSLSRREPKPVITAEEKAEFMRQRVAMSRAISRKMRIPTMKQCSADYFATVNIENITETCARYVVSSCCA